MGIQHLPNGIGESLGHILVTCSPLIVNGDIWYVDSATGVDAASPAGKDYNEPLATISQAHTNAASGDIIVFFDGHTETLTAPQTISKDLILVGAGRSAGKPTVKFSINTDDDALLNVSAPNHIALYNIWIEENAQTNETEKISIQGPTFAHIEDIYMECNGYDTRTGLYIANTYTVIKDSTFVSTATSRTSQPATLINIEGSTTLDTNGVILDAGSYGIDGGLGLEVEAGATGHVWMLSTSLLNGAGINLVTGNKGFVNVTTSSGNPRVYYT